MTLVMKGKRVIFSIVFINTGSGNDRFFEITDNVFNNLSGLAAVRLCLVFTKDMTLQKRMADYNKKGRAFQ